VQGGPAEAVDVVDSHTGAEQAADHWGMAAFGCTDERSTAVAVQAAYVSAVLQGQVEQVEVALARGDQERALHSVVDRVHASACRDEATGGGYVVLPRSGDELPVKRFGLLHCGRPRGRWSLGRGGAGCRHQDDGSHGDNSAHQRGGVRATTWYGGAATGSSNLQSGRASCRERVFQEV
jgi:hypothetical protein